MPAPDTITTVTHDPADSAPNDETAGSVVPPDRAARAAQQLRLVDLARDVERHVATDGWDQHPRLFALARTADLVALEPGLADALGADAEDPESLTPIEQDPIDTTRSLDEVLATTMWPDDVVGAALVLERLMLPPSAEGALTNLPDDDAQRLDEVVAAHPDRQDVRMAVVVTRDGQRICAVRLRSHDKDSEVLLGDNLVPRLADALDATFR